MQQQFNAGQTRGETKARTEDWIESAQNAANSTRDKAANATQSSQQSAQQKRDESAGFLQQTGEKMVHMAQGAVDDVKNTLGMGKCESNKGK